MGIENRLTLISVLDITNLVYSCNRLIEKSDEHVRCELSLVRLMPVLWQMCNNRLKLDG